MKNQRLTKIVRSLSEAMILFVAFGLSTPAVATIHTVSNSPGIVAQYSTLLAAHTAAAPGDTIYVHPSATSYGDIVVTKALVWIGAGFKPEGSLGFSSTTGQFTLSLGGTSGTVIKGLNITGTTAVICVGVAAYNNVVIENNRMAGSINQSGSNALLVCNGWVLRNNVFLTPNAFGGVNAFNRFTNCVISNNIFNGDIFGTGATLTASALSFNNNVFYHTGAGNPIQDAKFCTFTDNIFFGGQDPAAGLQECLLQNNLFFGNYTEAGMTGFNTQLTDNLMGPTLDPLFVNSSTFNAAFFSGNPTEPIADLHLQPGSPAVGSGLFGGDLGIYAGGFPWMDNPAGGVHTYNPGPRLPWIFLFNGQTVAPTDTDIQITIKGRNAQ
jgi:hypothetical protein